MSLCSHQGHPPRSCVAGPTPRVCRDPSSISEAPQPPDSEVFPLLERSSFPSHSPGLPQTTSPESGCLWGPASYSASEMQKLCEGIALRLGVAWEAGRMGQARPFRHATLQMQSSNLPGEPGERSPHGEEMGHQGGLAHRTARELPQVRGRTTRHPLSERRAHTHHPTPARGPAWPRASLKGRGLGLGRPQANVQGGTGGPGDATHRAASGSTLTGRTGSTEHIKCRRLPKGERKADNMA